MLLRSSQGARGQRPAYPLYGPINWASPQAKGLTFYASATADQMRSVIDLTGRTGRGTGVELTTMPMATLGGMAWDIPNPGATEGPTQEITFPAANAVAVDVGTMAFWIYLRARGSNGPPVRIPFVCDVDGVRYVLYLNNDFTFHAAFDGYDLSFADTLIPINQWICLSCSYNKTGPAVSVYVNGVSIGSGTAIGIWGSTALSGNLYLGYRIGEVGNIGLGLQGLMVSARWWNRVFTADQHWALYDPATRWDLYAVPSRRMFVNVSAAFDPALFASQAAPFSYRHPPPEVIGY